MLILISGKSGSGKSTIANYLCKRGFIAYALADKLKLITAKILKIEKVDDSNKSELRDTLQYFGTECFRSVFGNDFWCEQLKICDPNLSNIIISDIRYENERTYFRQKYSNVISVGVYRNDSNNYNHSSEEGLSNFDIEIQNNDSLESLYSVIERTIISKCTRAF